MSILKALGASVTVGVLLIVAHLTLGSGSRAIGSGLEQGGFTLTLVPFVSGLNQPVLLTHAGDGSNRLYVIERAGRIRLVVGGVLQSTPFLDIASLVRSTGSEQGLLGLAFHPNYATNGYFYVNYIDTSSETSSDVSGKTIVARYTAKADRLTADPNTAQVILQVKQPFANHNGGMLAFGPADHYLYIGLGDGGSGGDPNNNGQTGT